MRFGLFGLMFCFSVAFASEPDTYVRYDANSDLVSVRAHDVSLFEVLKQFSLVSGVEILADETLDRKITFVASAIPVERAIKQLTQGMSVAIFYDELADERMLVSQVRLLPKGVHDASRATSILEIKHAATVYAKHSANQERQLRRAEMQSNIESYDYIETRWLSRLSRLPLELREQVNSVVDTHKQRQDKLLLQFEERNAIAVKAKDEMDERKRLRDEELRERNPDRYLLRQQRLEEAREEMRLSLQE